MRGLGRSAGPFLSWRSLGAGLVLAATLAVASPASAQLLPPDFFNGIPEPGSPARVEATTLAYDAPHDLITAEGAVTMSYQGYTLRCDRLSYNQTSGDLHCVGNVVAHDPNGNSYTMDRVQVTGAMRTAVVEGLTVTTSDGAKITAADSTYSEALGATLTDTSYAPCGDCVDAKGNRIGWKVRAVKIIQDPANASVTLTEPRLEVLGVSVAWLPWLSLPDPTKPARTGLRLPQLSYSKGRGVGLGVPFFIAAGQSTDIILTPTLFSRQGFLFGAEWEQRFDYGQINLKGSGIFQADPDAFSGEVGDRDWRGAIQTTSHFTLGPEWTAGWSYTAFSDANYLHDYMGRSSDDDDLVNEAHLTHLGTDTYADLRVEEFKKLGPHITDADQHQQALAIDLNGDRYDDLGEWGQVHTSGTLLGVSRADDATDTFNTVPYVFGYEEQKLHATAETDWQRQLITPQGVVVTPFLGLRLDAAETDGASALPDTDAQVLYSATPIAAMDVRFPLMANNGADTHLIEPIGQLVYRGSDITEPGISNDNAQSFVLDDTNIFSYDRFSGTDRQETGLRANVGGRYLGNFANGTWLEVTAGESFHLAGLNGAGTPDEAQTGTSSGLQDDASYAVLGVRGSPFEGATLGAKLQYDPNATRVARVAVGADYSVGDYSIGGDYIYLPADSATGADEQQEITVRGGVPLPMDYWKAKGSVSWDLAQQSWLAARAEVLYDDGYFEAGAYGEATGPTHDDPDSTSFGITLHLKGPGGSDIGF